MPELPEVETIRLALEPHVVGRTFERVEIDDPRLVRPFEPLAVAAELEGQRVAALDRRGKYLIVRFESDRVLLIHLRMTGSLRHAARGALGDDPQPDGRRGRAQERFRVYGREGEPCRRCGTPIDKIRAAGRGTWYCPNCQRLETAPQAASRSASRPSRSSRQSSV